VNKYSKNILAFALGRELNKNNIFIKYDYLSKRSGLLICSDGFWDSVNAKYFNNNFNTLIDKVFASIPNDNVSFIRYSKRKVEKEKVNNKWYLLVGLLLLVIGILYFAFTSLDGLSKKSNVSIEKGTTFGINGIKTIGSTSSIIESVQKEEHKTQ
jgi:hypothetical protein